ncbi:NAD(P)-dependent dehydrogenase, short-chain alcohol dehydrogenase family [Aliiroseovarius halocynthiae]|uniref:SDR family oxidoreductase n=1 Tax=Aliiroseovarius halocynthiae TaxID=985055 RepID=A0A545SR82_9RHOB|nr:SDR family oxidoreductase [Aliiroseovarius halocynthiae]TQV67478.1 SDR family oxidoreductase [Aliiroseovarius halocynthiae]SMR81486.1 NAD(P)-dependent dehydrogenase, short-chain alcohol dehydrogenase family [Aliiroseovarius halocynthiae]
MCFENQSIVVTGGNSGIGRAAAKSFRADGAKVAILGRDQATLAQSVAELEVFGRSCDVTDRSALEVFMADAAHHNGQFDVLFANAGIAAFTPFEGHDPANFKQVMDVNFHGTVNTIAAALPHLNDGASIILTTSVANQMGEPNSVAYAASKAAVKSLVSTLSTELAPRGIRVNAISPGPTATPIFNKLGLTGEAIEQTRAFVSAATPANRMGEVSDQVDAVLYLASKRSSFVVGQEIVVDGGLTSCASLG